MKVKFVPQNVEFEIEAGKSVMHAAQDHGLYIKSVCKGVPSCAECRVRVVEGEHNVMPPGSEELSLIGSGHFIDRRRLSCQLKCFGDITVDMTEQIQKEQGLLMGRKRKSALKDDRVEEAVARRSENVVDEESSTDANQDVAHTHAAKTSHDPRDARESRETRDTRPTNENRDRGNSGGNRDQNRRNHGQQSGGPGGGGRSGGEPRGPRPQNDRSPKGPRGPVAEATPEEAARQLGGSAGGTGGEQSARPAQSGEPRSQGGGDRSQQQSRGPRGNGEPRAPQQPRTPRPAGEQRPPRAPRPDGEQQAGGINPDAEGSAGSPGEGGGKRRRRRRGKGGGGGGGSQSSAPQKPAGPPSRPGGSIPSGS